MKKKLSMFLALVMALTMVMGMSVMAFASIPEIDGFDTSASYDSKMIPFVDDGSEVDLFKVSFGENRTDYTMDFYINDEIEYSSPMSSKRFTANIFSIEILTSFSHVLEEKGDMSGFKLVHRQCWYGATKTYAVYFFSNDYYAQKYEKKSLEGDGDSPSHTHNFQWQTITEPSKDADGLEGEVCSCGAVRNTQPLSAYGYSLNEYATPMINAAKSGQTITFEFGEWNSFPKSFMAKLAAKNE